MVFVILLIVALANAQRLVLYDATKLSNTYKREISTDGTMKVFSIRNPGNLVFVPRKDSYLYTVFGCQDFSTYNTLEVNITAPSNSNFYIELQDANNECTKKNNIYVENVKSNKTIRIPFRSFHGINTNKAWAISMHGFSALNREHVIHSISVVKSKVNKIPGNNMYVLIRVVISTIKDYVLHHMFLMMFR